MKLFRADITDDCEEYVILIVSDTKENAKNKILSMEWDCLMCVSIEEIKEVDGYNIKIEDKTNEEGLQ